MQAPEDTTVPMAVEVEAETAPPIELPAPNSPGAQSAGEASTRQAPLSPSKTGSENAPPPMMKSPQKQSGSVPASADTKAESTTKANEKEEEGAEKKLFVVETHHETEEVIERLLDVKGLEQSVTGLWGWMSGSVAKVAEQATKVAKEATVVAEKASQQASIVAEKATQQASIVAEKASKARAIAEQQAKEIAATVSKTMEDRTTTGSPSEAKTASIVANLPWETAHPERRAEARDRVMKLSMDDHTFTVPPPKEANYVYDAAVREPYAARMLDTDALLSAKRFKLVPKAVDEQEFWRNYFYRVDLILGALGVPATPVDEPKKNDSANSSSKSSPVMVENPASSSSRTTRDLDEEMRKEIARAEASHVEGGIKDDENFDMLDDDLEFDEDDPELEKSMNELKL